MQELNLLPFHYKWNALPIELIDTMYFLLWLLILVPGTGLEPVQPQWPRDFKSLVSTNSTIRAYWIVIKSLCQRPLGNILISLLFNLYLFIIAIVNSFFKIWITFSKVNQLFCGTRGTRTPRVVRQVIYSHSRYQLRFTFPNFFNLRIY